MATQYQDYYQIIGVPRSATQDEVQRAFRKLARKYHPDVNDSPDAEERFKQINEAREVLGDPEKRRLYDSLGNDWEAGQNFSPPHGWEEAGFRFRPGPKGRGMGGFHFDSSTAGGFAGGGDFSDFFESLFGAMHGGEFSVQGGAPFAAGRGHGAHRLRGSDQETEITISLEDAHRGAQRTVRLESIEPDANGTLQTTRKSYRVNIPAGVTTGSRIRLGGQGGKGANGNRAGDLYLRIRLAPHARFRVEGHDLVTELRVAPWEAALGAKIQVPTLDGDVLLSVPAGIESGRRLRLRGKGLPRQQTRSGRTRGGRTRGGQTRGGRGADRVESRGDLYVEVIVATPRDLSDRERELFEELARNSPFNPRP